MQYKHVVCSVQSVALSVQVQVHVHVHVQVQVQCVVYTLHYTTAWLLLRD